MELLDSTMAYETAKQKEDICQFLVQLTDCCKIFFSLPEWDIVDSEPKMSETWDQAKRYGKGLYHLIQPWGAVTHTVRDGVLAFALDLCNSGVTELLTAASAERCV